MLRKWLLDGKPDCLDTSDEDAQYAQIFKFSEQAGHHIEPVIISTGGGSPGLFPFGIPPVSSGVHPTGPPQPATLSTGIEQQTSTHVLSTQPSTQNTPSTTGQTLSPSRKTGGTLYPNQGTTWTETLYPGQKISVVQTTPTHPETLYPNQPTLKSFQATIGTRTTKLKTTWWPFGRETFETTKEYVGK